MTLLPPARVLTIVATLAVLLLVPGSSVRADDDSGADWSGPLLSDPALSIFSSAGGVLHVQTASGLVRSDDAGATFRPVPLPPGGAPVAVDPLNANVLFATGDELLYRSRDAGGSWQPVLLQADYPYYKVLRVAVSPADDSIAYAALATGASDFRLLGSVDGGSTWTVLQKPYSSLCYWSAAFIVAHPTDTQRVIHAANCLAGRDFSGYVQQSRDGGRTFSAFWPAAPGPSEFGYPRRLVGGQGSMPARWYLALNGDTRGGGSTLLRTDDDGATWQPVLEFRGGGTLDPNRADADVWDVEMHGLAYTGAQPDTVYVARTATSAANGDTPVTSGVMLSTDAGQTWSDLGNQQLGSITDLAIASDGSRLYLTSDLGMFSLALL